MNRCAVSILKSSGDTSFLRRAAKGGVHLGVKAIAFLSAAALCAGCTTPTTTTSNPPDHRALGDRPVYTQRDLEKTGQPELGPALETLDPSLRSSHP